MKILLKSACCNQDIVYKAFQSSKAPQCLDDLTFKSHCSECMKETNEVSGDFLVNEISKIYEEISFLKDTQKNHLEYQKKFIDSVDDRLYQDELEKMERILINMCSNPKFMPNFGVDELVREAKQFYIGIKRELGKINDKEISD